VKRSAARRVRRSLPDIMLAIAELSLTALLALALARLVWTVVTPVTTLGDWRAAPPPVADLSLLGSFDPFFRSTGAPVTEVTSLALVLVGTRVDTVSGRGSAIIGTPDGVQSSYLVGETVLPGVRLKSVSFDAVTLERGGAAEQLFLDQSTPPAASASPPAIAAPAAAGTPAAAALPPPRLGADLAIAPRTRGTAITGFVLNPRGSGAAFAAAGLQPGDVLVSVDGAPVTGLDPATLGRRLDSGGVTIGIERGGRPLALKVGG